MGKGTGSYIADTIGYRLTQLHETKIAVPAYLVAGAAIVFNATAFTSGMVKAPTYEMDNTETVYSQTAYENLDARIDDLSAMNSEIKDMEFERLQRGMYAPADNLEAGELEENVITEEQILTQKEALNDNLNRFFTVMFSSPDLTEDSFAVLQQRLIENDLAEARTKFGNGNTYTIKLEDLYPETFKESQAKINFNDSDSDLIDAYRVENVMHSAYNVGEGKFFAGFGGFLGSTVLSVLGLMALYSGIEGAGFGGYYRRQGAPKKADYKKPKN